MKLTTWIQAFRPQTLPLALSCALMGSFLASAHGYFRWDIFFLTMSTAVLFQTLSNLANDYGDAMHGVDNEHRIGPMRVTQSGAISKKVIEIAIVVCTLLALISSALLIRAGVSEVWGLLLFSFLGIAATVAAITYTIGKTPYGYSGLGDLLVFLFFGLIGVIGTYYLHTKQFNLWILLPASSLGFFSSGVLNLNNMRDIENDSQTGKRTLVVRMGSQKAKIYHALLIISAILFTCVFMLKQYHAWYQLLFLLMLPFFIAHLITVLRNTQPVQLNSELERLSLGICTFTILFGLGLIV